MRAPSIVVALAAVACHLPALAQSSPLRLRAQAAPGEQVLFLLSLDRGPAVQVPGCQGVLRLDLGSLAVLAGGPCNAQGVSECTLQVPLEFPATGLHCQAVRLSPQQIAIGRRTQPLVDRSEAQIEHTMPLGDNIGGPFLFDLSSQDIVDVVSHYFGPQADPEPVLASMRRPFVRLMDGDESAEVGVAGACQLLRETWRLALERAPMPAIDQSIADLRETLGDAFFVSRHPAGVADGDELFDGLPADTWTEPGSGTSGFVTFEYKMTCEKDISRTWGGYGVKGKGVTKAYSRPVGSSSWTKCDVYQVKVTGTLVKNGSSATAKTFYDSDYSDWKASDSASFSDSPFSSNYYELDIEGTMQVSSTSSPRVVTRHAEGYY